MIPLIVVAYWDWRAVLLAAAIVLAARALVRFGSPLRE